MFCFASFVCKIVFLPKVIYYTPENPRFYLRPVSERRLTKNKSFKQSARMKGCRTGPRPNPEISECQIQSHADVPRLCKALGRTPRTLLWSISLLPGAQSGGGANVALQWTAKAPFKLLFHFFFLFCRSISFRLRQSSGRRPLLPW